MLKKMPPLIRPRKLKPGATIGIVAPASPMDPENLEKGVRYLESLGYRVAIGRHVYARQGYLAGSDADRAADLQEMFTRPDIDAIFCVRGGFGVLRILHLLDYDAIRANPKILVGYSDITALQLSLFRKTGLITFSGPMVAVEMARGIHPKTEEYFWQILTSGQDRLELPPLAPPFYESHRRGKAVGRLLGGCLSLVSFLIGTPYGPDFSDALLFLEDVGEEPYRIDGRMAHLRYAGILEKAAGLILGKFEDCEPARGKPSLSLDEVLNQYLDTVDVPSVKNFDYGHGKIKHTLPVGLLAELDADEPVLTLMEPAVETT